MEQATSNARSVSLKVRLDRCQIAVTWVVVAMIYPFVGPMFFATAEVNKWSATVIYSYAFDIFSILTGLLFAFYSIVVASENEFMRFLRERSEPAYRQFRRELRVALSIGAGLTVASLPYLVTGPTPTILFQWPSLAVAVWFGTVAAGFHAFWRVASTFFLMVDNAPTRPPLG